MKNRLLTVVLLAGLVVLPAVTRAAHDERWPGEWAAPGALQWRLGEARGWQGHAIYYRYPGERRWRQAPGAALDLADGWVIGTDRRNGGYGIYRWSGRGWQRMPGAAVDIGGSWNRPWVVNDRGERFVWSGYGWREDPSARPSHKRDERDFREERREDRRDDWRDDNDRRGQWPRGR